jgi:tetratricopeptide (TPR) repeat protein|tara:strand:+ start:55 stop:747 length:693 start_codon:yes stop_codon:yes gene_type:complete
MKNIITTLALLISISAFSQSNQELLSHYQKYYKQMQSQSDIQGVINALTHLNILSPNQARTDTLATLYMNEGRHVEALNTIGIEKNEADSDLAVQVKAFSLKAINDIDQSLIHYEELFKRKPNPFIAYELAEMKIRKGDLLGATSNITFGIANSSGDIVRNYYETQQPYSVPMKAAFIYLKGLVKINEDRENNIDETIGIMEEALVIAPNFNMAKISIDALTAQKNTKVE